MHEPVDVFITDYSSRGKTTVIKNRKKELSQDFTWTKGNKGFSHCKGLGVVIGPWAPWILKSMVPPTYSRIYGPRRQLKQLQFDNRCSTRLALQRTRRARRESAPPSHARGGSRATQSHHFRSSKWSSLATEMGRLVSKGYVLTDGGEHVQRGEEIQ